MAFRSCIRVYEQTEGAIVVGGLIAFYETHGMPPEITIATLQDRGQVLLQPYDLMYEMCKTGRYDLGEVCGLQVYKKDWPAVYSRSRVWAATHHSRAGYWSTMLSSMETELSGLIKKYEDLVVTTMKVQP
jgi:hypothetical protein